MKYSIGVDIGGTKTACGLVDSKGRLRKKVVYKTGRTKSEALKRINDGISLLLEGVSNDVIGIGVGIPGVVDVKTGKISKLPNLKILNGVDLVKILKKKFRKKVSMMNDANCSALGEYKFGVGCGAKSLFVVTLGTGIGGGVVIDGKIYSGRGNASEPGHMILEKGKEFEDVASGKVLNKLIKKKGKRAYDEYAHALGIGLSNIIKLYDPQVIVISGGVASNCNMFLNKAIAVARKNTFFPIGKIVVSNFPKDVGVIGAASLLL